MLRDSIKELSIRYSFKPQFGEEMPEYFEALDDGIQSINAQIRMKEALKDFLDFAGDMVLVGHNVLSFDLQFFTYKEV